MDGFFVIVNMRMDINLILTGLEPLKDPKKMETDGLR
jgi:hypothetical protein